MTEVVPLSGDRSALPIAALSAVASIVTNYASSLLTPEKRLELGAWVSVLAVYVDKNFLHPLPPDPKFEAAVQRQGPVYAYVTTIAGILNPLWILGSYSLLAKQLIERLAVPKSDLVLTDLVKKIEEMPLSFVGDKEGYGREFVRGLVASTTPNATLPFVALQLAHAAVLKVT